MVTNCKKVVGRRPPSPNSSHARHHCVAARPPTAGHGPTHESPPHPWVTGPCARCRCRTSTSVPGRVDHPLHDTSPGSGCRNTVCDWCVQGFPPAAPDAAVLEPALRFVPDPHAVSPMGIHKRKDRTWLRMWPLEVLGIARFGREARVVGTVGHMRSVAPVGKPESIALGRSGFAAMWCRGGRRR
jgi:hypothetical protein